MFCVRVLILSWATSKIFPGGLGFPGGSEDKASACNAGDLGSIPASILAWRIPWTEEPVDDKMSFVTFN